MRYEQCEGCPLLMAQSSAFRGLINSHQKIEIGWTRVHWFCSNGGIRPMKYIPYCELSNKGKGGVHRQGGN